MFQIALKHWVIHSCIDIFFESIKSNFGSKETFKIGSKIPCLRLSFWDDDKNSYYTELHNAEITSREGNTYSCTADYAILGSPKDVFSPPLVETFMKNFRGEEYECIRVNQIDNHSFSEKDIVLI